MISKIQLVITAIIAGITGVFSAYASVKFLKLASIEVFGTGINELGVGQVGHMLLTEAVVSGTSVMFGVHGFFAVFFVALHWKLSPEGF